MLLILFVCVLTQVGMHKLISGADSGDTRSLWGLCTELTPQSCTYESIRVVLKNLNPELVPNIATGEHTRLPYKDYADRALACLSTLPVTALACEAKPSLNSAAVPQIVQAVEGICLWINFCLHFGLSFPDMPIPGEDFEKAYFNHSLALLALSQLDSRIFGAMCSSSVFVKLVLRLWMTQGKHGQEFMTIDRDPCPIISLMALATQQSTFSDHLLQQILSRGCRIPLDFARSVIARAQRLVPYQVPPALSTTRIDALVRITERLVSACPQLRRSFVKVDYLKELSRVLNSVSLEASQAVHPIDLMRTTFQATLQLAVLCMANPSRVVHNWRDLIAGNLYPLLLRCLEYVTEEEQDMQSADVLPKILQAMTVYAIYPCALQKLMQESIRQAKVVGSLGGSRFRELTDGFKFGLEKRNMIFQTMARDFSICDNLIVCLLSSETLQMCSQSSPSPVHRQYNGIFDQAVFPLSNRRILL